jgi:hypothetical protein
MMYEQYTTSGARIREYFEAEANALLRAYQHIETLIPHHERRGAAHAGEEGRHIESLVRSFLNKHLPRDFRALSGFILRPATRTRDADRDRLPEGDAHSRQLDVIVYDIAHYPVYEQFEEFVIVPPEGVVAIVSVKKRLYAPSLSGEIKALGDAVYLCRHRNTRGEMVRGPNTALLAFTSEGDFDALMHHARTHFEALPVKPFDSHLGQMIVLDSGTVFKSRPYPQDESVSEAEYIVLKHGLNELHLGLQFLLTGILSSIYDPTRTNTPRPGFTSFQPGRDKDAILATIPVAGMRCKAN